MRKCDTVFSIDSRKINRTCKYGFHRAVLINNAYVLRFIYCFAIDIPIANLKPALFKNKKSPEVATIALCFAARLSTRSLLSDSSDTALRRLEMSLM